LIFTQIKLNQTQKLHTKNSRHLKFKTTHKLNHSKNWYIKNSLIKIKTLCLFKILRQVIKRLMLLEKRSTREFKTVPIFVTDQFARI
jgi:hypothetical protein